jgi:hypothetical protein
MPLPVTPYFAERLRTLGALSANVAFLDRPKEVDHERA